MKKYFLHNETEQQGPFNIEDLRAKNLSKDTPIWYEGLSDWTTADNVVELRDIIKTELPPPFKSSQAPPPFKIPEIKKVKSKSRKFIFTILGVCFILLMLGGFTFYQYSIKQEEIKIQNASDNAIRQERENNILKQKALEENKKQQIEKQKFQIRNNWYNYIKVERSSYTYQNIGGISDLFLTVTNNTDYTLDYVSVKISYIKANGAIYKTEVISFNGIAPQYQIKKKAPDSERGTSVDYIQITSISSKGLNFCYEEGNWANKSNDPYKCD